MEYLEVPEGSLMLTERLLVVQLIRLLQPRLQGQSDWPRAALRWRELGYTSTCIQIHSCNFDLHL